MMQQVTSAGECAQQKYRSAKYLWPCQRIAVRESKAKF